jgi:hypothetical protein
MGKLVRAGQIFVTSLDATPRETDVLTGLASIDAGEITADEIVVANLKITGELTSISDTTQFAGTTNVNRLTATQVGIGTDNPINDLQIGTNDLIVNRTVQNLVTVRGNVVSTNVLATDTFKTTNDSFVVDADNSNVITVTGNTVSTNVTVNKHLHVGTDIVQDTGANVAVFENGNVVIRDGFLQVFGNIDVSGNLSITEIPSYTSVNNLVVSNAVILMGDGNNGTYDMAVLMRDGAPDTSNVFLGYTHVDDTFKLSRTYGTPEDATFTMDSANTVNLHVFGDMYTQNNVGIANTSPAFSLSVGSNVYINDVASSSANVLHANGYGFFEGLRIGDDGLTVGSLITLDADAAIPMVVSSKIEADGIQTTGVNSSGIANTNPAHTLSIGDKIFFSTTDANAVTVIGNTATGRLITESIRVQDFIEVEGESGISSAANVIIHGDITGEDSTSNTVSIRAGPLTSNISALEINGAKESPSHQSVIIKTKNTERLRVVSGGNVGLSNTEPSELLTLGGNLKLNDSNAAILGSDTTYLKAFTDVNGNQTRIENRVGTGKGLNFYASTTDTMGTPKMTILETSNVGIGTITPKGLLHTSGGTVFINNEPVNRVAYNHLNTPMVISNTVETEDTVSQEPILELTREGVLNNYEAVRATFKLGKHDLTNNKSKTQLDIYLADEDYSDETDILTLRSDGRVGIGSTVPEAFLEVVSSGIGNARENSLMIHNHHGAGGAGDAIMAAQTDATQGNAFTSYIQTTNDSNPRGWSVGITGTRDFRITRNINEVSDSTNVGMYIDGSTRNMGIGTDTPRAKLEVNGNVVIGNELYFGGLLSDEYGNTFIKERLVGTDISELLIFKGNEGPGGQGPDQIRLVGSQHVFQAYSEPQLSASDISDMERGVSNLLKPAMLISGGGSSGRVLIGTTDTTKIQQPDTTTLFVNGGVEFAPGQKINFGNMDIYASSDGGRFETIGSSGDMRFQNKATAATQELFAIESMRIKSTGLIGIGTTDPSTNVHIYSGVTTNIDVLKLESPGTNTKTGIRLNTNDGYGGYVRGYTTSGTTHGIVVGGMNNAVEADGLHVIHTSNVGVGTSVPSSKFHVYNGTARLEHATSNAILEFKTTGGVSNIYGDHTGNVFVDPVRSFIVNSDTEIVGDLQIDGKIDLGNQVAVDLGGRDATAALEVGGGFISNSNEVACKRYAINFTRTGQQGQDVQLRFDKGSFYAKIVAILRSNQSVHDMSTMVLEVQGGTHDGTTNPLENITIGTKNLFGGGNLHPWNPAVTTGKFGLLFAPEVSAGTITYYYDLYVEMVTSRGGKLLSVFSNNPGGTNAADNFSGAELVGPNTSTNATGKNFGY